MPRKSKAPSVSALTSAMKKVVLGANSTGQLRKRGQPARAYTGRGFYKGFGGHLGSALGAGIGAAFGNSGAGAALGGAIGKFAAKATGWGKYNISRNSLIASVPQIRNPKKEGMTQIRHCEYIGDVYSSSDFKIQYALPINAGMPSTFPWASSIAQNFTQYEMNGAMFEFRSTSGDATGSNTALGSVILATNYDSVLPPFTNKQQMLNQEFSIDVKPSQNVLHPIECANAQSSISLLYTRTGAVPPNTDPRMYDLGTFYLATQGNQLDEDGNPVNLGSLWITYDILLAKPLLAGTAQDASSAQFTALNSSGTQPYTNLGQLHNSMGVEVSPDPSGTATRFSFPAGYQATLMTTITGSYTFASGINMSSVLDASGWKLVKLFEGSAYERLTQDKSISKYTYTIALRKETSQEAHFDLKLLLGSDALTDAAIVITEISEDVVDF